MKISSISDVHIKVQGDMPYQLIKKFFNHREVQTSDIVILNGDIFDILIGGKAQYLNKYEDFFLSVKELTKRGIKVLYIEGNHDFHIQKVVSKAVQKFGIDKDLFTHIKNKICIEAPYGNILFTHGDDIEIENSSYQNYKRKINNPFVKFLGDYIVPFKFIEWIGHRESNKSRGKNEKQYELSIEGQEFVKEKFRKSADIFFEKNTDVAGLVCGHSHCKDLYQIENKYYINNGYAPKSNSFILVSEKGPEFIDL